MVAVQKLQNSIQRLIIVWPDYPLHTNSLFRRIFCHFPPLLFLVKTLKFNCYRYDNIISLTAVTLGYAVELPYELVEVVGTSAVEAAPSRDGRKAAFVTCSAYWHGNMHCPSLTFSGRCYSTPVSFVSLSEGRTVEAEFGR